MHYRARARIFKWVDLELKPYQLYSSSGSPPKWFRGPLRQVQEDIVALVIGDEKEGLARLRNFEIAPRVLRMLRCGMYQRSEFI